MTAGWTLFGLAAVFMWVAGTFFDKYLLEKYFSNDDTEEESGPGALMIFSSYFSFTIVILILAFKSSQISLNLIDGVLGMLVGLINGAWILLYLFALNKSSVEKVVPVFQLVPIFGLLFSSLILGEFLLSNEVLGVGLLMLGALIILHYKKDSYLSLDLKTLGTMLSATSLVALSEVAFKYTSLVSNYWTAAFWTSVGFTLFGVIIFMSIDKYREEFITLLSLKTKQVVSANSINEIVDNTAEFVFFFAITIGPVVMVQSLNAYQPILALFFGILLMKVSPKHFSQSGEKITAQKIAGIIVVTIASIYLYLII